MSNLVDPKEIKLTIRRDKQTNEILFATTAQAWSPNNHYDRQDELADFEALERKHLNDVWVWVDAEYQGQAESAAFAVPKSLAENGSPDAVEAAAKEQALTAFTKFFSQN